MTPIERRLERVLREPLSERGGPWDLTSEQLHLVAALAGCDSGLAALLPAMPVDASDSGLKSVAADAAIRGLAARGLLRVDASSAPVEPSLASAVSELCGATTIIRMRAIEASDSRTWTLFGIARAYRAEHLSTTDVVLEDLGAGSVAAHLDDAVPLAKQPSSESDGRRTAIAAVLKGASPPAALGGAVICEMTVLHWLPPCWTGLSVTWATAGDELLEITDLDGATEIKRVAPDDLRARLHDALASRNGDAPVHSTSH